MYDKIFNCMAVATLIGVGFISCTAPMLLESPEEPLKEMTTVLMPEVSLTTPDPSYAFEMKANKDGAKAKMDSALEIFEAIEGIEPTYVIKKYVGDFYLTMYAATVEQCGNTLGITASGREVTDDPTCHTVAVDPSVIPLGTYLMIEGYEGIIFRADDTGSAVKGYHIDIFTTSESESKTFDNVYGAKVWIVEV